MTRSSSSTLVNLAHLQMLPSQQLTGKRKPDDSNPLLHAAAAKRAKKEAKAAVSNKRKLNPDDIAGGLLVVRAPDAQPSMSQPINSDLTPQIPPRFSSQPISSIAGPSKPSSKKFKADDQASATSRPRAPSQSKSTRERSIPRDADNNDSEVESAVKAMEIEADDLRRNSRLHTTVDPSLLSSNNSLLFTPRSQPNKPARTKGKGKVVDTLAPLPESETPQLQRNKQLREGAMAAISNGNNQAPETNGKPASNGHRRKSSVGGRGKRISSSFEATGVITQPHNSVAETSFYKHIDCDLPDAERVRQLLIWCSHRAAGSSPGSVSKPSSSSSPPLPPLSSKAATALKGIQEGVIRMLAEKRIDLSVYSPDTSTTTPPEDLGENEQNVRNRHWQSTYSSHIQQAQIEEEAWKKVSYGYEAYSKKLQASLEKRSAYINTDPQSLSAKAKGKRRATGDIADIDSSFLPHEHELPPEFHPALSLAKTVLGHHLAGEDRIAGGRGTSSRSGLSREEMEAEIKRRLPLLEFKFDQLYTYVNSARATTNVAEHMLTKRFEVLSANLQSRSNPRPQNADATSGSSTQLLHTYVSNRRPTPGVEALDLMRALTRIDTERPPAKIGDAARQAAREVQRAGESGAAAVGDRRLTGVPPSTPRKAPGTPRRGNTPARDR